MSGRPKSGSGWGGDIILGHNMDRWKEKHEHYIHPDTSPSHCRPIPGGGTVQFQKKTTTTSQLCVWPPPGGGGWDLLGNFGSVVGRNPVHLFRFTAKPNSHSALMLAIRGEGTAAALLCIGPQKSHRPTTEYLKTPLPRETVTSGPEDFLLTGWTIPRTLTISRTGVLGYSPRCRVCSSI